MRRLVLTSDQSHPNSGSFNRQLSRNKSEFDTDVPPPNSEMTSTALLEKLWHMALPQPGDRVAFQPFEGMQGFKFTRPVVTARYHGGSTHKLVAEAMSEAVEVLSTWAVATMCRHLSLSTILTMVTSALLEMQLVVFCPDLGVLSAICLAMLPLLQPFEWQSLLLPILPSFAYDFLQAPVPFILGVQYRTEQVEQLCSGLLKVNVQRDHVKNATRMPRIPGHAAVENYMLPKYLKVREVLAPGSDSQPMLLYSSE